MALLTISFSPGVQREFWNIYQSKEVKICIYLQLIAELKTMRGEREQVNTSLERLKRENDLANKNVSQLRLEQER